MPVSDIFKVSRKTFFNPSGWLGWNGLKSFNAIIFAILRPLFSPSVPEREETFDEAMARLGLTDVEVQERIKTYRTYALAFLLFAIFTFAYSFYLLFSHTSFLGMLLGFVVTGLFLSQAFKYDFWSLQMRQRRLGLTFEEWKRSILGVKGNKS